MSKGISKTLSFTAPDNANDIAGFKIYYAKESDGLSYNSPNIAVPAESGKTDYEVKIPGDNMTITEGTYLIGVTAVDNAGNESDIEQITYPFDFVAPAKPTNLKVS